MHVSMAVNVTCTIPDFLKLLLEDFNGTFPMHAGWHPDSGASTKQATQLLLDWTIV